jgi:hypothetical protein
LLGFVKLTVDFNCVKKSDIFFSSPIYLIW